MSVPFDPRDFAQTSADAALRFAKYKSTDPLPDVAPALLNTADLLAYIALTGMIWPFGSDPAQPANTLKPASCAVAAGGLYVYWTDPADGSSRPRKVTGDLKDRDVLALERNSIVYLTLAPEFRLPDYIAARFNLKIRDIYRGLLVGTGPLVDPGFTGRLSIPIHNLTSNQYELVAGEPLVWMEFTKLSPNERWNPRHKRPVAAPETAYVPFPENKGRRRDIYDYLRHANADQPIRSSIPELVGQTQKSAQAAQELAQASVEAATALERRFTRFGVIGLVATIVAVAALVIATLTVIASAQSTDDTVRDSFRGLEQTVATEKATLAAQAAEIARLQAHQTKRP